jgi:hypothetical protein
VEISLLVLLLVVAAVVIRVAVEHRAREAARNAYQQSLDFLQRDPTNPDLRSEALRFGRAYSRLTRNRLGVASFDEVALANDINAACAAMAQPRANRTPIATRLAELSALRNQGLIDEAEHTARRAEILRSL